MFAGSAARFMTVGALLYAGVYAAAEALVHQHADRNRFFMVRSAPPSRYDFVVLGASHAAVFDYRDMNARLERMTDARIMNLSVVGGGVTVNSLLFDYFTTRHQTDTVVYVVDSFAFYSPAWNEERLHDRRLFARAPFDPALARLLWSTSNLWPVAIAYTTGFSKINDQERLAGDRPADEGARFDRRYRAVPQLDEERLAYLYPAGPNPVTRQKYLDQFEALVRRAQAHGATVLAIKPPIPERIRRQLPGEDEFDAALSRVLQSHGLELHDLSRTTNDEALFYDSDHLNQTGVLAFFEKNFVPLLTSVKRRP
jgi:hypothetical protein